VDATTVTLAGAPAGKTWVRGTDDSREELAALGKTDSVNHHVWVGKDASGALRIMEHDIEADIANFGDAAVPSPTVFASRVRYTPADATDYSTAVTTAQAALDDLAGRVTDNETDIADHETRIDTLEGAGSGSLPAFGAGVIKTLSSGVATAGSDRHLILAAESGTADDCIEISGLSAGDEVIVRADSGDTITLKHNDGGATDKIILYNNADIALTGDQTLKLVKTASGKVVQYVDEESAGGSFSQSYLGYNTIGGSQETWAGVTVYYKQITLASAALLVSIDVYLDLPTVTNVQNINSWVTSDNAGAPNLQIALGTYRDSPSFHLSATARWLSLPISVWLPAGTYWVAVQRPVDSGSDLRIYYDGSGSDIKATTAGAWSSDYSQQTPTTTSNRYSIRASILS
jgi:hypothetical protein